MKEIVSLHQKMYLTTYLVSLGTLFGKTYDGECVTERGLGVGYCNIYAVKVMVFKKFSLI